MSLNLIHARLADTATLFIGVLALWALFLWIRKGSLEGGWFGAAVIGEVLILVEGLLGGVLYLQGMSVALPRPYLHILYGIVAVISLPAAYSYFSTLADNRSKTLAMAVVCAFLWGILLRTGQVAQHGIPGG